MNAAELFEQAMEAISADDSRQARELLQRVVLFLRPQAFQRYANGLPM